jgi:uncharacterized repeat protein (TIGR03803 family)
LNVHEVIPMKSKKFYPSITPPLAIFIAMLILAGTIVASEPKEAVLHHFGTGTDGAAAYGRVIFDSAGKLYGTTVIGGGSGVGTVFELSPPANHHGAWTLNVLHTFACGSDGCFPWAGLTMDSNGTFYGTTQFGGLPSNGGTVFALKQVGDIWFEGVVFSFKLSIDQLAAGAVLLGKGGTLYGTTIGSEMNAGAVFKIQP